MLHLGLTRKERNRLEKQLKAAPDVRVFRRTLALLELDRGKSVVREVAIATHRSLLRRSDRCRVALDATGLDYSTFSASHILISD